MHQSRFFNIVNIYLNYIHENKILAKISNIIFYSIFTQYAFVIQQKTVFSSYRDFLTNSEYYHSETVKINILKCDETKKNGLRKQMNGLQLVKS